MYGVSLTKPV